MRSQATKDVVEDLEDLLNGLKMVRHHMDRKEPDRAEQVLAQAGVKLTDIINSIKVVPPR